jgi:hypothetical protein
VAADDPGVAGDRLVCLIDGIAADNERAVPYSCLRIDDGIAADHRGPSRDASGDVEIAEENEDVSCNIPFHLYRTEDAGCVVNLLPLGDEDVLVEIST